MCWQRLWTGMLVVPPLVFCVVATAIVGCRSKPVRQPTAAMAVEQVQQGSAAPVTAEIPALNPDRKLAGLTDVGAERLSGAPAVKPFIEYRWSGGHSPNKSVAVRVEPAGHVHVQVSKYSGKEIEYRTTLSEAELGYLRVLVKSSGFFNERGEERQGARVFGGGETELRVAMDGKEHSIVFGPNRNLTALTSALLRLQNQGEMIENLKTGENIYAVLSGVSLRYGGTKALQPQVMVQPLEEFVERTEEDGQKITWAIEALSFVIGPEEWVGFIAVQLEKADPDRRLLLDQMITGHPFYANIPDSHLATLKPLLALEVASIEAVPEPTERQTDVLRQMKYLLRNKDETGGK